MMWIPLGGWQGRRLFCISHVVTHQSESISSRGICQETHFGAGKDGIEERSTYVTLYMHVTQMRTQLPYQLHTKLSVRPLSFRSRRPHCVGLFTTETGLSLPRGMQNHLPVSFWAIRSCKFSQVCKSTANSFLQGSVLFRHGPIQR